MVKLSKNDIAEILDNENGTTVNAKLGQKKEINIYPCRGTENFSVFDYEYGYPDVVKGDVLNEGKIDGHSFCSSILDLNKLMAQGVLKRGNKIDLSSQPVYAIQVSSQEQLDMLTDASKKKITKISISNGATLNYSEDVNGIDFDGYRNNRYMDRQIDLSAYPHLENIQVANYQNEDLEEIKLPSSTKSISLMYSNVEKLRNLQSKNVDVTLLASRTSWKTDDPYKHEQSNNLTTNLVSKRKDGSTRS